MRIAVPDDEPLIRHLLVLSRLLGIAGSVGDQAPADIRQAAVAALAELVKRTLPGISADLAADDLPAAQPLLTEEMLKGAWPASDSSLTSRAAGGARLHVRGPSVV